MTLAQPILTVRNVSFSYTGPRILEDVSLSVVAGDFLGLIGPNAGGKSTLLKLILGLLEPHRGEIRLFGDKPIATRRQVGYVPQHPEFARDFPISVEQVVLTGRLGTTRWWGPPTRRDRSAARAVMDRTEVAPLARRAIGSLSGGQLQRVLLARALVAGPRLLILDEPTSNLDLRMESEIFDLLRDLTPQVTIIIVSHDVGFISKYVTRVACLNRTLSLHETVPISGRIIQDLYDGDVRMVEHRPV